jgi:hypothetical protein
MNAQIAITEAEIANVVNRFYGKVLVDPEIGPVSNDESAFSRRGSDPRCGRDHSALICLPRDPRMASTRERGPTHDHRRLCR